MNKTAQTDSSSYNDFRFHKDVSYISKILTKELTQKKPIALPNGSVDIENPH